MPNRILKESICFSDDIDRLTPFEETVFYRLMVCVDDYGRLDARPQYLKSKLFATKKGVTEKNVEDAVSKLASVGLVRFYRVDERPFLLFPKWARHQRIRNSKEKYPAPEDGFGVSPQPAANCGGPPPESESESNPHPNPKSNPDTRGCAFMEFAGSDKELLDALAGFEKMRRAIKNPLTDRAKAMLLTELSKISSDRDVQIAVLNRSVLHNWKSVYPLEGKAAGGAPKKQKSFAEIVAERSGA